MCVCVCVCVCVCTCCAVLSHVQLFATPCTVAGEAPLSLEFSRQEYWSRLPFPTPRDLLGPGIETSSFASPALVGGFFATSTTWEAYLCVCVYVCMYTYIYVCMYCIYCFLLICRKLPIKCMFANYVVMNLVNVQTYLIMGTTIGDSSPTYTERCREVIIQRCSLKVFLWWGGRSLCRWKHANQPRCECLWSIQYWLQSLIAQLVKNPPAMQETWVWFLGQEDLLEKG